MKVDQLANLFSALGAPDPKSWADSQIDEGIPQLGRFLFLRQAWRQIISSDDDSWIYELLRSADSKDPDPGSLALKKILESGASKQDVINLVRTMQCHLLFAFCYLLDDPGELEETVSTIGWSLFQTDNEGNPLIRLSGLHESVNETDPEINDE